jgi:hypothetical protein
MAMPIGLHLLMAMTLGYVGGFAAMCAALQT